LTDVLVDKTSLDRFCCGPTIGTNSFGIAEGLEEKMDPPARLFVDRDLSSSIVQLPSVFKLLERAWSGWRYESSREVHHTIDAAFNGFLNREFKYLTLPPYFYHPP
jgi:hypothetical protein